MRIRTVCPFCAVGCGIIYEINDGKITKVTGDKNHPVSKGDLCIKGLKAHELLLRKDRLKTPLLRTEHGFKKISWKEAIRIFSERAREIIKYGEFATFASSKCTNEENYLVQKIHRIFFQNNNIDNCARLCHAPSITALNEEFGVSAMMNGFNDFKESELLLIMGANPKNAHPIGFKRIMESPARKITIDIYKTETAKETEFIQIKPNSDHVFLIGMIKHVFEEGLVYNKARSIFGFELLEETIKDISWKRIERKTSVYKKDIKEIADEFAKKKATIIYGMGITQKPNGVKTILYMGDLCLITDNVEYTGTGINPLRGHSNVQGCCDMGCLPNFYPGYSNDVEFFESFWKTDLPHEDGLTEPEIIKEIPYTIKGMWIIGENPVKAHSNTQKTIKKLKKLDFLVVQDIFLTETAELADLILPGSSQLEKTGTITNTERRVQVVSKIVDTGLPEEWRLLKKISDSFGIHFEYTSPKEIFNEIRAVVTQYRNLRFEALKNNPQQWGDRSHLFLKKNPIIYPVTLEEFRKKKDEFFLISVRSLIHFNTNVLTRTLPEDNFVIMDKEDMDALGIKNEQEIELYNRNGSIWVKVREGGTKGIIIIKSHYDINKLVGDQCDDSANIPAYKFVKVRVRK